MVEKVSFKVYLKDAMSSGLAKLAKTGNSTYSKLIALQRNFNRRVIAGKKNVGGLSNSLGNLKSMIAGYAGFQLFSNIFKWGAEQEQARISFQTLLQDVEKGNRLFAEINQFANMTPFNNRGLQANAKTLLAFNISGEKIMGTLKMLGDVAGGNKDRMRALTLAYAQSQAAGKLMGQDLLQFINAGFNPLQIISKKTGKTLMELREEMQKGAISSEMIAWAFKTATSEGGIFNNMMEKQSQTIAGKWSTLVGTIQYKLGALIETKSNAITSVLNGLITMVGFLERHAKTIGIIMSVIGSAIAGYYAWIVVMKLQMGIMALYKTAMFVQIGLTRGWAVAQRALNMALIANPIGIVIAAIAAIAVGIYYAWNKFEGFRKVVLGVWGVIKLVFGWIKTGFMLHVKLMLWPIKLLWDKLEGFRTFIKVGLWGTVKQVFNWIADKVTKVFGMFWRLIKPVLKLLGVDTAYNTGAAKGIRGKNATESGGGGLFGITPGGGGGGTNPDEIATGSIIGGISGSGGSSTKNITISIGSLIQGNIEFHTTNISEGLDDLKDKVSEILLQAVNDANLATG